MTKREKAIHSISFGKGNLREILLFRKSCNSRPCGMPTHGDVLVTFVRSALSEWRSALLDKRSAHVRLHLCSLRGIFL